MISDARGFRQGDRVRYATTDDNGFELVRYGFVGAVSALGAVIVLFDDELGGDAVNADQLELVDICSVTLKLTGSDLLDDPILRPGLVNLWRAEADDAGLEISDLHPIEVDVSERDATGEMRLANITTADHQYTLRAMRCPIEDAVILRCERANHWAY